MILLLDRMGKFDIRLMKFRARWLSLTALAISSCASFNTSPGTAFSSIDYAVSQTAPNGQEISLGQERLQNFLQRANAHQRGLLGQYPVVAVQAYEIDANEVPGLVYRLSSGQVRTAGSYYSSDPGDPTQVPVKFLLLFDSRTGRLVSSEGVLAVDTPPRGTIANLAVSKPCMPALAGGSSISSGLTRICRYFIVCALLV